MSRACKPVVGCQSSVTLCYCWLRSPRSVTVTNIATDGCFQKLRSCKFIYSRALYSMVQLALNDDCSVPFTLWNGRDDVVFACLALERRISAEEHHPSCRTLKRSRLRSTRSGAWGNAKRTLSWFMQSMFIPITLLLIGRCLMKISLEVIRHVPCHMDLCLVPSNYEQMIPLFFLTKFPFPVGRYWWWFSHRRTRMWSPFLQSMMMPPHQEVVQETQTPSASN